MWMSAKPISFVEIVKKLSDFWESKGAIQLFGFDCPVGAGTWHPEIVRSSLLKDSYSIFLIQPSRRANDARCGSSHNRLYLHHQFQLLIAPIPSNMQKMVLQSLDACGIDRSRNNIEFEPGDWRSPSMGAFGSGYEIICNGTEVGQYTYFQTMLDKQLKTPPVEVAYGLERLAMIIQKKSSMFNLDWSGRTTWGDLRLDFEKQSIKSNCPEELRMLINLYEKICYSSTNFYSAYEAFVLMSHSFNLLESTIINYAERNLLLDKVRDAGRFCGMKIDEETELNSTKEENTQIIENNKDCAETTCLDKEY